MSQRGEEIVLGIYKGRTVETLWAQAVGNCPREAGFDGYTALSCDRCVALGTWTSARDLELSLGIGDLSRVRQAGDRLGGGSGAQGGSGHTPLSLELRSAVDSPTCPCMCLDIGEICVR